MTEPIWMRLYNARGAEEARRWLEEAVGQRASVAAWWRKQGRAWWAKVEPEQQRYRRFVERWVRNALTDGDWRQLSRWCRPDLATVLHRLLDPRTAPRWTVEAWFLLACEAAPLEIVREAYLEIAERMLRERWGVSRRPRLCEGCGRLCEPDRSTQVYCSARCRYRIHQRAWRARRRADLRSADLRVIAGGVESGEAGRRGERAGAAESGGNEASDRGEDSERSGGH